MIEQSNDSGVNFRVSQAGCSKQIVEQNRDLTKPIYPFKCSDENCEQRFHRIVDLHNHLFYDHNQVKQSCPICQQQFPTPKLLRLHEKTHGEYECSICGQRFNEKSYLKLHFKNHDFEREVFSCTMCGKTFKHKGNLQVHIKSKHEKQKFRCMLCDRELSTKQKLDQHMTKRHKAMEEDLEIDIGELEEFEKEWASKKTKLVDDFEEARITTTKKIKLEPEDIFSTVDECQIEDFHLADSDLEFLYND